MLLIWMLHAAYSIGSRCFTSVKVLIFRTLFSPCSQIMFVFRTGIHKMVVRIANREDPDQTASDCSGSALFVEAIFGGHLVFQILAHLPY